MKSEIWLMDNRPYIYARFRKARRIGRSETERERSAVKARVIVSAEKRRRLDKPVRTWDEYSGEVENQAL